MRQPLTNSLSLKKTPILAVFYKLGIYREMGLSVLKFCLPEGTCRRCSILQPIQIEILSQTIDWYRNTEGIPSLGSPPIQYFWKATVSGRKGIFYLTSCRSELPASSPGQSNSASSASQGKASSQGTRLGTLPPNWALLQKSPVPSQPGKYLQDPSGCLLLS